MPESTTLSGSRRVFVHRRVIVPAAGCMYACVAFLTGCHPGVPPSIAPRPRIVVGAEAVPLAAPFWLAAEEGYFLNEGLDVEIRRFESGRTALLTMLEEPGIHLVTVAQTPIIAACFDRQDYAIVAGMGFSDDDVKLLVRRDRGITEPGQLKGRMIGITSGSSSHYFLDLALAHYGLTLIDVRTVHFEPGRLARAFARGEVDAIATWEPHVSDALQAMGDRAKLLPTAGLYREQFFFVGRKAFIEEQSEALPRFLRAVATAERRLRLDPERGRAVLARCTAIGRPTLARIWEDFTFELFLNQQILDSLEEEARWAMSAGLTRSGRMPNFLDFVDPRGLRAAVPQAVALP